MGWYDRLFPTSDEKVITNSNKEFFDVAQTEQGIEVGSYFSHSSIEVENMDRLKELRDVLTAVIEKG